MYKIRRSCTLITHHMLTVSHRIIGTSTCIFIQFVLWIVFHFKCIFIQFVGMWNSRWWRNEFIVKTLCRLLWQLFGCNVFQNVFFFFSFIDSNQIGFLNIVHIFLIGPTFRTFFMHRDFRFMWILWCWNYQFCIPLKIKSRIR